MRVCVCSRSLRAISVSVAVGVCVGLVGVCVTVAQSPCSEGSSYLLRPAPRVLIRPASHAFSAGNL